jgi:hypothetical protein
MLITALVPCYNEADILRPMLRHWTMRGMRVFVLDNWSTDGSFEIAQGEAGVTVERWPQHPIATFEWGAMLDQFERRSGTIETDWFAIAGADQYLDCPWRNYDEVVDEVSDIDAAGFNAIQFDMVNYLPHDDQFVSGDPVDYFTQRDPVQNGFLCCMWKKSAAPSPHLARAAAHDVDFDGRKISPLVFTLRHYPIRSQAHGTRKVFKERKARWSPSERAKGWHVQYDDIEPGHRFVASR